MFCRKILCFILLFVTIFSLGGSALAKNDLASLEIKIPEQLQKIIDEADTKELAKEIKEKLDSFEGLNDDEILELTKQLCERWSIQLSDEQMKKAAEYISVARDFDIEDIENKIDEVKTKVGAAQRVINFIVDSFTKLSELISIALDALSNLIDSFGF